MTGKTQEQVDQEFSVWFERSFDLHFKSAIVPYLDFIASELGEITGQLARENDLLAREIDLLSRDIHNVVVAIGGTKNPDTGRLKLQKLDDVVAALRNSLREEMVLKIKAARAVIKRDLTQSAAVSSSNITALPVIRK